MAVERRRPLPEGRYWFDVVPSRRTQWETWLEGMKTVPSVTIEHSEHIDAVSGIPGIPDAPEREFVIFSLKAPNVAWEAAGLASPTIAPASVQSAADTVSRPEPEPDLIDQAKAAAAGLGTATKVGLGVGAAVVVVALGYAAFKR